MFENIGGKIKKLAKVLFVIVALSAVISAIAVFVVNEDLILLGLSIMIAGPIVAWISSWTLYAFGELVEDVHAMRNKFCPKAEGKAKREPVKNANLPSLVFYCPKCNKTFTGSGRNTTDTPPCPSCNTKT